MKLFNSIKSNIKFILIMVYTIKLTTQFMLLITNASNYTPQAQISINVLKVLKSIILV